MPYRPTDPLDLNRYLGPPGGGTEKPSTLLGSLLAGLPTLTNAASLLDPQLTLAKHIENRFYKNQHILLDGYTFKNCGFHNCILNTDSGLFTLEGCSMNNCKLEFGPNAVKIIQFWHMSQKGPDHLPGFNPKWNPDGTFTIE